ncbi:hypothetical protein RFI_21182 [Reticulomyxa filosa]|uniref:Uncharacterized protein n=1 Tax=Reticulomyxa filosa TaxID=46433 RepID=X6MST4_RETFI|nr:hypothetical protein RFI_21182 [Reticulomyxa filosa]|eukprot:ETO16175.1 hypothetical protein RFI_21182 [Reticulomyxa filosa]
MEKFYFFIFLFVFERGDRDNLGEKENKSEKIGKIDGKRINLKRVEKEIIKNGKIYLRNGKRKKRRRKIKKK